MKTILLPLFALFCLCTTTQAQFEIASAAGVPPFEFASGADWSKTESAVAVPAYTTEDRATLRFGSGLKSAVNVQVLSPDTDVVINRDVAAGQSQLTLDLAGLPDGTYTVRLKIGTRQMIRQLVKG